MRTFTFKDEFETSEMVVRLEMAESKFKVTGRRTIMMHEHEPALVLPPTFIKYLRERLSSMHILLKGVEKSGKLFIIHTTEKSIAMVGTFSVNDIIKEL